MSKKKPSAKSKKHSPRTRGRKEGKPIFSSFEMITVPPLKSKKEPGKVECSWTGKGSCEGSFPQYKCRKGCPPGSAKFYCFRHCHISTSSCCKYDWTLRDGRMTIDSPYPAYEPEGVSEAGGDMTPVGGSGVFCGSKRCSQKKNPDYWCDKQGEWRCIDHVHKGDCCEFDSGQGDFKLWDDDKAEKPAKLKQVKFANAGS